MAEQGLPDVVIANAGISVGMDTAERADLEVMREVFATNNIGLAATFHPFLAPMRERGHGTLVGIASVAAIRGLPGHGAYCASKAGVVAYCESLRGRMPGPSGVQVVTLLPGYIATPLTARPIPLPDALPDVSPRPLPTGPSAPSPRATATASSPGRWAWWPSCCGCCPTRCSTACLPGAAASPSAAARSSARNACRGRSCVPAAVNARGRRRPGFLLGVCPRPGKTCGCFEALYEAAVDLPA